MVAVMLAELQYHFPMGKYLFWLVAAVVVGLAVPVARGLEIDGLYEQRVAVENESVADRRRAFRTAFRRMIVKITGDERWLENPRIDSATAGDYVQAFAYVTPTAAGQGAGGRLLEVQFSAPLINRLLESEGVPVWGRNRPSVLVWMIVQDAAGDRGLLDQGVGPEIVEIMRRFGEERGLPIIFPLLDIEDRRNLPLEAIWAQNETAIRSASDRYDPDSILVGRLLFTAAGELVGLWRFLFADEALVFDGYDADLASYIKQPLTRITRQLAGHYALTPDAGSGGAVRLRIDGIGDFTDYSTVVEYVRGIDLVRSADLVMVEGERLELMLELRGDAGQLFSAIALDRDLLPVTRAGGTDATLLHYRWMR